MSLFGIKEKREAELQGVADNIIDSIGFMLQEDRFLQDELAAEDKGWLKLSSESGLDLSPSERNMLIKKSRMHAIHDPLSRQMIRLWTDYSIGNGVTWHSDDEAIAKALSEFWDDPLNRSSLRFQGQRKMSQRLLTDGEIFFALFEKNNQLIVRTIDPLQISTIAVDPNDNEMKRWYVRKWFIGTQEKTAYYPDWQNDKMQEGITGEGKKIGKDGNAQNWKDVRIYHVAFDTLGTRGAPLLACEFEWLESHRQFMRSRVIWQVAKAAYARKISVKKGGKKALEGIRDVVRSALATGTTETNPAPAPGSTWLENTGAEATPIDYKTGSSDAQVDGGMLLQMVGAGASIFPHYLGAGESFRLATASAMELPMLKCFGSYQMFWKDIYADLLYFSLQAKGTKAKRSDIEVDMPPIIEENNTEMLTAIAPVMQAFPQFVESTDVQKLVLMLLGVANPEETFKAMEETLMSEKNVNVDLIKKLQEVKRKAGLINVG